MTNKTISFIGAGNMASSLIGGLCADGYEPGLIWASDPRIENLNVLQTRFGIQTTTDNKEAIKHGDCVVFAVKPQIFSKVAEELKTLITERNPLVVSIAAGITITHLENLFSDKL